MDEPLIREKFADKLQSIRNGLNFSINKFAILCEIPVSTLESYLYARSMLSVETIISICNKFHYSVNTFLEDFMNFPTEQVDIAHIIDNFGRFPDVTRDRIYGLISPLIESVVDGVPVLQKMKCGARLRLLREDLRYSTEKVANKCGVEEQTLKNYESSQGFPGIPIFLDLCRELQVTPEYLLCNDVTTYSAGVDRRFYNLTPRQLSALAVTSERLYNFYRP